jgi:hypothetical protein
MRVKTNLICIFFISCSAIACNSRDKEVKEFPKKIVGRWMQDKQMLVLNAFDENQKNDTTIGQEAAYKPAEIEYGSEGTYLLLIKDLNDDIKLRRPGRWNFSYDTLLYIDIITEDIIDRFIVKEITDSTMEMSLKTDFDDDGNEDDFYTGYYKRIIR